MNDLLLFGLLIYMLCSLCCVKGFGMFLANFFDGESKEVKDMFTWGFLLQIIFFFPMFILILVAILLLWIILQLYGLYLDKWPTESFLNKRIFK